MREVKSVKVDNWGVFFLQKLQNFFNKTDYCDLTLQFNDNSQLKVHRLVLSACTDYFNALEQTCDVIDDIVIMPPGLQADVIVPIVNFMYTGTLEFEIDMYGRLLKTARDMNMTVLLKLLEAHKRTVDTSRSQTPKRAPRSFPIRRPAPPPQPMRVARTYLTQSTAGDRRVVPVSSHQLKTLQIKPVTPSTSYYTPGVAEPATLVAKYAHSRTPVKGPSRFECSDETTLPPDSFEQFDSISYESKPLITANQACKDDIEDYDNMIPTHDTSSTFEQLRKSYTGIKRPLTSVSSLDSPPEKKPNIQDVKEYAEQQRMRKQITAEYDDDNEYDDTLDDEFHHDDDDEDYVPPANVQRALKKAPAPAAVKIEKDQKPTIVVKDTVGSNVNHAKIISEVLKKYPHLVKNNKNIKLKIMAKSSTSPNQQQSIVIKQEPDTQQSTNTEGQTVSQRQPYGVTISKTVNTQISPQKSSTSLLIQRTPQTQAPVTASAQSQQQPPQPRSTSAVIATQKIPVATNPAPRRIDSKTMHSLIAMGAENTTGPWLCLRCGVNGRPISIPSYRGFRRHLVNTHKEKIDARLCEHCGWRSRNDTELHHHLRVQHDIEPPVGYDFPVCSYCPSIFLDKASFEQHLKDEHADKAYQQQCMYCDEVFKDENELFTHMQTQHKSQAQKDGLIDYTDDEESTFYSSEQNDDKIKILSNITISPQPGIKEAASKLGTEALSTVATGIAASLGLIDSADSQEIQYLEETDFISTSTSSQEPKFVNADGQIMELTPEQRNEIISQLGSQPQGGVVMVLNQESFTSGTDADGDAEELRKDETEEPVDESLLAAYDGEAKPCNEEEKPTAESAEQMDWQDELPASSEETQEKAKEDESIEPEGENGKIENDVEVKNKTVDEVEKQPEKTDEPEEKKEDDNEKIEKAKEKLKLLAGDWSDDEEDENEENPDKEEEKKSTEPAPNVTKEDNKSDKEKPADDEHEVIFETVTAACKPTTEASVASEVPKENVDKAAEDAEIHENSEDTIEPEGKTEAKEQEAAREEEEEANKASKSTTKSNQKDKANSENETKKSGSPEDITESDKKETEEELETEKKAEKDDDGKKKEEAGGDHIRTLISEWGDDEEDEDL